MKSNNQKNKDKNVPISKTGEGKPELRFGGFEGDWEELKLKDVSDIKMGQSPNSVFYNKKGKGIVLIQGNADIVDRKIRSRIWTTQLTKKSNIGDLIMTVRAPVGYVAKSEINSCIGRGVCSIRSNKKNDNNFLYQFLLKFEDKWFKYGQGSTFFSVNSKDVRNLKIKVPSKLEQQKIADFLGGVDEWIENLEKEKESLEKYKKGVMQKIFSETDGWKERKLGDLIEEVNKKTTKNNQFPILSSTKDDIFLQNDYFKKEIASRNNKGYKILEKDQLVFSPQNLWLGNINLNTKFKIGIVSPSYKIYRIKNDIVLINYFKYLIRLPRMLYEYKISSEQGASVVRRNLNIDLFEEIPLKLPLIKEQQKIAEFLTSIDDLINSKQQQISSAKSWKKGLMQRMFV